MSLSRSAADPRFDPAEVSNEEFVGLERWVDSLIAAARTPPWPVSVWECRGRRLSKC
jgi:hypothetical protein